MKKIVLLLSCLMVASAPLILAADQGSTSTSSSTSPIRGIAGGVKKVVYEGPKDFAKETAKEATKKPPIVNVVEGVNKGTEKLLDHTIKGAYKVATLGTGELKSYEIEEPKKGSDDTMKIKIKIPGT